jgi:hypothetical protein
VVLLSTFLFDWCQWLQHTPLATTINESIWLFPVIEGKGNNHDPDPVGRPHLAIVGNPWHYTRLMRLGRRLKNEVLDFVSPVFEP